MSDPIREAYDARRLLMQRLNAILDDRWPLSGKIMAAVDEYAEARSTPAEALSPEDNDIQRRCWTIQGPDPISQCVFFNGHEGQHWFGTTEGRWVPEGEACCSLAAQVIHVQSQGGKIHIGLGERCEDNVAAAEPDGTAAGALASILDETKGGPWKPDDGTSLWFYNEAGDQLHLTGDDVALLLGRCDCVCARHG